MKKWIIGGLACLALATYVWAVTTPRPIRPASATGYATWYADKMMRLTPTDTSQKITGTITTVSINTESKSKINGFARVYKITVDSLGESSADTTFANDTIIINLFTSYMKGNTSYTKKVCDSAVLTAAGLKLWNLGEDLDTLLWGETWAQIEVRDSVLAADTCESASIFKTHNYYIEVGFDAK